MEQVDPNGNNEQCDELELQIEDDQEVLFRQQEQTQVNQEQTLISHLLEIGEYVDYLLPQTMKWVTREIVEIANSMIKISDSVNQNWVQFNYENIRKQWIPGVPLTFSRVDVYNPMKGWLEGIVIKFDNQKVLIHHVGYKKAYDQFYNLKDVQALGYSTNVLGIGKYLKTNPNSNARLQQKFNHFIQVQELINIRKHYKEIEISLHNMLNEQGMFVKEVEGDGNCMFRALSDQLYGNELYHYELRRLAMDYIRQEKEYFQDYIINGDVEAYIEYKMKDGIWGDNIELQAFRELYDIPIEIYVCSKEPLKTGLEYNPQNKEPIRLSYHGRAHYNSIKMKNKANAQLLPNLQVGEYEKQIREKRLQTQLSSRAQFGNSISNELDLIFNESKRLFNEQLQKHEQMVIQESIKESEQEEDEDQLLDLAIQQSQLDVDQDIMKTIIEQSRLDQEKQILQQFEDTQFQHAIKESVQYNEKLYNDPMTNPVIVQVMAMGCFSLDNVIEAFGIYGCDPEMIINYLYENNFQ